MCSSIAIMINIIIIFISNFPKSDVRIYADRNKPDIVSNNFSTISLFP